MESKTKAEGKLEGRFQRRDCRRDEVTEFCDCHLVNSAGLC